MIEFGGQRGVLLVIVSLVCLGCVYAFCVCCKKRSTLQQEDNILYDKEFHHDNSKSVKPNKEIRPNQVPSALRPSTAMLQDRAHRHVHRSYENIPNPGGIYEPAYVYPIPDAIYANERNEDYENADFLKNSSEDDYVNVVMECR